MDHNTNQKGNSGGGSGHAKARQGPRGGLRAQRGRVCRQSVQSAEAGMGLWGQEVADPGDAQREEDRGGLWPGVSDTAPH